MKAARLESIGKVSYLDVPTPRPATHEALLHVKAVSVCGSDIKRVAEGHRQMPIILGHECAGVVVEVGEGVDPSLVGTRASVIPLVPCFSCEFCAQGLYSACKNYSFIGSRRDGCFAEYVALPARNLFRIGEEISFEEAALYEPLTVIIHGLKRCGFVKGGSVAILGSGSLGLLAIQWLKTMGAGQIIASDVDDGRLELASRSGAHITVNPQKENLVVRVTEAVGGGVGMVLELSGSPQALQDAVAVAQPRGKILLTGNQPKHSSIPGEWIEQILRKELELYGTWMSYSAPFPGSEWREAAKAHASGALSLAEIVSNRYPLSEAPEVFEKIVSRQLAYRKIMLFPEGTEAATL